MARKKVFAPFRHLPVSGWLRPAGSHRWNILIVVWGLAAVSSAAAASETAMDKKAFAACLVRAAKHYRLPPKLLLAIKVQESGRRIHGDIVHRNRNGTYDIGPMQINSIWLKTLRRYGIDEQQLKQPCVNVYVGAWILRNEIDRHGLVQGIAHYHSPTPKYQRRYLKGIVGILKRFSTHP